MTAVTSLTRVRVVVDHPTANINKVKDLALIFWSASLPQARLHILSKTSWASVFLRIFFTHIHLMTCLSSMVNHIAVTTLWLNALVSAWSPPRNPTARPGPLTDGEGLATPSEEPYPAVLGISVLTVPTTEKSSVRHCCDRGHVMAVQWQSRWCTESYCSEPPERRPEWWGAVRRS